jgi:hypothetical protein
VNFSGFGAGTRRRLFGPNVGVKRLFRNAIAWTWPLFTFSHGYWEDTDSR